MCVCVRFCVCVSRCVCVSVWVVYCDDAFAFVVVAQCVEVEGQL